MTCPICTPHFHCPIGMQYWAIEVDAQTNLDAARRELALAKDVDTAPYVARVAHATNRLRAAQDVFDRHIGKEPEHDIVAGYDWTEIDRDSYPALLRVCRAMAVRIAALEAARPYTTMTPPPYFTRTPPPLYTDGCPQAEPEVDA